MKGMGAGDSELHAALSSTTPSELGKEKRIIAQSSILVDAMSAS
jgi:hypothetical protein